MSSLPATAPVARPRGRLTAVLTIALSLAAVLLPPSMTRAPEPAGTELKALSEPAWQGWATSMATGGRRLATITPTPADGSMTATITVDAAHPRQTWLGTGASLTDAAVSLMQDRPAALAMLYDPTRSDGAHLNLLRLPLTATDLSRPTELWSFDWSGGSLSPAPAQSTASTTMTLAAKALQPQLRVLATPWSGPPSMKQNRDLKGGDFVSGDSDEYASMLDAQAAWLLARGVPLKWMTMVNEPENSSDLYPTMRMSGSDMANVARTAGPKLQSRGVELWAFDHNWDHAGSVRSLTVAAPGAFDGAALHCYAGNPSMMSDLPVPPAITECTGSYLEDPTGSLKWDAESLVRDANEAGSRGLFMWSLALDPDGGPKVPGTCYSSGRGHCRGLLKIDPASGSIEPQAEFYTLAHLSRAADPGSRVLPRPDTYGGIIAAAFLNGDGTVGVYGFNSNSSSKVISVRIAGGGERQFSVGPQEVFSFRGPPGSPDPNPRGRIIISPENYRYYVDTTGYRHFINSDAVFNCNGGWANAVQNVPWSEITAYPEAEAAACFTARSGDIIRHPDGDSYVLGSDGAGLVRYWIPTGTDFLCARAEGRAVVEVTRYQIAEIRSGADRPGGNCIVRGPGGDSHFINNEGRREWIPDSPTWDCEIGRGVPVRDVSSGFISGVPEVGWHYCLNKANLRNKVLRHADGDSYFIHADDTKTWIPDGATYSCRTRQGYPVVETRWREYVNAFPGSEWDYCYDINTLKGRIITHPDGDSHYVDTDGVRHWIPSGGVYNCLRARGIPADTIRWREYITRTPEREWAVCGDTLATNQKLDRGQWLQSSDGRYRLIMQGDGNLVLYNAGGRAIWATNRSGVFAIVQGDGNLVEYASGGPVWASNTVGTGANRLVVQNDGNLVLYSPSRAVWASNTVGR